MLVNVTTWTLGDTSSVRRTFFLFELAFCKVSTCLSVRQSKCARLVEAPELHFIKERLCLLSDVDEDGSETSVWTFSSLTRIVINALLVKTAVTALTRHRLNQY